jgi:hypothetical protein
MTLNLSGGRRLLLAGSQLGWFWVAAGLLTLILLWTLYRAERRLVSRRAGLFLLGLRVLAALAMVTAFFEPIAARVYRETLRGRVVVAVDVSQSMETADPGRNEGQGKALARALNLSAGERVEALPRREVARRLLDRADALVARLASEHAIDAVAFARASTPTNLPALAESLRLPARADDPASRETDWQPALSEALRSTAADAPVLGVVLLTDGQENAPSTGDSPAVVYRLASRGVPVFPILIGSTVPPRDAAIAAVRAPESVYRGDVASIQATIKLDGAPGREVAVTLDRPDGSPLRQVVRAPIGDRSPRPVVTFRVPLEVAGTAALTLAVGPLEGDVRPDNDRRTVTIQVADDKADVLLVDSEARWEFRYLRNALARDPHISVKAVVVHQPVAGVTARPTYDTTLPARTSPADRQADPLGSYEAIVIGDVDPADLPSADWARLEWFVAERGGTLVLSPGPRSWAALVGQDAIRKLVPVIGPRPLAIEPSAIDPTNPAIPTGVGLVPTAAALDASAWPMFALASEASQNRAAWAGLPRLPWVIAGRAKPGATLLATAGTGESSAAVAAQPYGLGKVLWVGTDGTWRWRHRVGDAYHHRFWGQVMRWAASSPLAAGNRFVRFGPLKSRAIEGEGARLQARIADGVPGASPDLLIAARVYRLDATTRSSTGEAAAVVPLSSASGQPRTYDGTAPALPAGAYAIRLDVPQLAEALHLDSDRDGRPIPEARLDVAARDDRARRAGGGPRPARTHRRGDLRPCPRRPRSRPACPPARRPDQDRHSHRGDTPLGSAGRTHPLLRTPDHRMGRPEATGTPLRVCERLDSGERIPNCEWTERLIDKGLAILGMPTSESGIRCFHEL